MLKRALLTLIGLAAATSLAACGSSTDSSATDGGSTAPSTAASDSAGASSPSVALPTGDAAPKNITCTYTADGSGSSSVTLPPSQPAAGGTVEATIKTTSGDVPITLDAAKAPCTVNSFLSLATQGFFDNTPCHRLTTSGIYVLQCGDPTGTGTGGPGYAFADETSGHDTYPTATLAMANAGPNTNGSQFFLCYGDCSALNTQPNYTVFGKIGPKGLLVLQHLAQQGTTNGSSDGPPKAHTKITGVTFP